MAFLEYLRCDTAPGCSHAVRADDGAAATIDKQLLAVVGRKIIQLSLAL